LAAAGDPRTPAAEAPGAGGVAATVDGVPITVAEVDRELARALGPRPREGELQQALRRQTLQRLIDRRLVLAYLAESSLAASGAEVDLALKRVRQQVESRGASWAEYLQQDQRSEGDLRAALAWDIGWQRLTEKLATDENLARYFQQHRRDFDGTELRVAHILWKAEPADDPQALAQAVAQAEEVRGQIRSGKISFAEAARRHSQAPTAQAEGDIGIIGRRGPMPEAFSQAAFQLDPGQVSAPVVTAFGVHLITCLEVKAGTQTWQEARGQLQPAVERYLFQWAADQRRPQAVLQIAPAFAAKGP
jgi:parvulin-like peptidyl-prolyl isomerase